MQKQSSYQNNNQYPLEQMEYDQVNYPQIQPQAPISSPEIKHINPNYKLQDLYYDPIEKNTLLEELKLIKNWDTENKYYTMIENLNIDNKKLKAITMESITLLPLMENDKKILYETLITLRRTITYGYSIKKKISKCYQEVKHFVTSITGIFNNTLFKSFMVGTTFYLAGSVLHSNIFGRKIMRMIGYCYCDKFNKMNQSCQLTLSNIQCKFKLFTALIFDPLLIFKAIQDLRNKGSEQKTNVSYTLMALLGANLGMLSPIEFADK